MIDVAPEFAEELAELEALIAELPPESRLVAKALFVEKLQTGQMASLRFITPPMPLRQFVRQAWHVLESNEFQANWHTDAICDHLEAVIRGDIRNIIINIPPRCSKSILVSVMWPAWVWSFKPTLRWLFASYADDLATEHSWKARVLIQSAWYQENWGHVFQLVHDNNLKTRYDNTKLGYRKSTAVGSSATGFGGDLVVTDDPNNVKTVESETARNEVINWWDKVMSTRLNDIKTGHRVIIQQRCHEQDLTGHVLEKNPKDWEKLILPMEFEAKHRCTTSIGFSDPRVEDGELLVADRFDRDAVEQLKDDLLEYGAAGQLQQRPAPPGGGMFKRAWFPIVELPPRNPDAIVRYWDCAGTEEKAGKDPDWTVGTRISIKDHIVYIEQVVRGRWDSHDVDETISQTADTDGDTVAIREEQEGGSAGKAVVAARLQKLAGKDYEARPVSQNKVLRARPLASQAKGGNVRLVRGDWNEKWLDEMANFPRGKHDDQVDSASGGYNELVTMADQIMVF